MNKIQVALTSLVSLVFMLLAACSQAPAPQADDSTLTSQAVLTVSDKASCEAARGRYDAFGLSCTLMGTSSVASATVSEGNTLEFVQSPALRSVSFRGTYITNRGTLKLNGVLAIVGSTYFFNTGTLELNGNSKLGLRGSPTNSGTITINGGSALELSYGTNFDNNGKINVNRGGRLFIASGATLVNYGGIGGGSVSLACGSGFDNQGRYGGSIITNANSVIPSYALAQGIPTASCDTTDGVSGVATPASLSIVKVTSSGDVAAANPPTATGTYRARCSSALDNADNTNARTVTFKVTR
jgi:hypothetical protein